MDVESVCYVIQADFGYVLGIYTTPKLELFKVVDYVLFLSFLGGNVFGKLWQSLTCS
jgi:hypothetical protein